jgi:hypothetical protein
MRTLIHHQRLNPIASLPLSHADPPSEVMGGANSVNSSHPTLIPSSLRLPIARIRYRCATWGVDSTTSSPPAWITSTLCIEREDKGKKRWTEKKEKRQKNKTDEKRRWIKSGWEKGWKKDWRKNPEALCKSPCVALCNAEWLKYDFNDLLKHPTIIIRIRDMFDD